MDTLDPPRTALLFVDPYNDFLSEGGKLWPQVAAVAQRVGLHANLRAVVAAARAAGLTVVVVPHRRFEPGDYEQWDPTPYQLAAARAQVFARGEWGGEWHPHFARHVMNGPTYAHAMLTSTEVVSRLARHHMREA